MSWISWLVEAFFRGGLINGVYGVGLTKNTVVNVRLTLSLSIYMKGSSVINEKRKEKKSINGLDHASPVFAEISFRVKRVPRFDDEL